MTKKKTKKTKKAVKKRISKEDKQLYWVFGIMIGLIVIFLIAHSVFASLNHFEYEGLSFTKEKFDKLIVYHYYYYFDDPAGNMYKYNLFLRNDPRENDVPVFGGKISYPKEKFVYIGINSTGITECERNSVAIASLSNFLADNLFEIKGGLVDENEAENNSLDHVSCEKHPDRATIVVQSGEETRIDIEGLCYTLTVSDCEILEAVEKFEVQSILDAKD